MSFANLAKGRPLRLTGAIAIAVILVLVVAWLAVHFSSTNNKAVAQEKLIRQAVDDSGVVSKYDLLKVAEGKPGFTLEVSLREDAPVTDTGALLHTLYDNFDSVAKVNLGFSVDHSLSTSRLERTQQQWTDLVAHIQDAAPVNAAFSQVGPTGAATYWLDLKTLADDPAAEYERLQQLEKPVWLTYGNLELKTAPDAWPALLISAGRDVTSEELDTFRTLNQELATTVNEGEHYELKMRVELGAESAEFEMRIITEPLNHSPEATSTPGNTAGENPSENSPGSDPATDDAADSTNPSAPKQEQDSGQPNNQPNTQEDTEGNFGNDPNGGDSATTDGGVPSVREDQTTDPAPGPNATQQPAPLPDSGANSSVPPLGSKPNTTPQGGSEGDDSDINRADASSRIETISYTLGERTELILKESGISAFVLTIQVDNATALLIRS